MGALRSSLAPVMKANCVRKHKIVKVLVRPNKNKAISTYRKSTRLGGAGDSRPQAFT